eukprot:3697999-Amphidinium_carterae.1
MLVWAATSSLWHIAAAISAVKQTQVIPPNTVSANCKRVMLQFRQGVAPNSLAMPVDCLEAAVCAVHCRNHISVLLELLCVLSCGATARFIYAQGTQVATASTTAHGFVRSCNCSCSGSPL